MIIRGIYYKKVLTYAGSFFVFLGVLGIFLPIFPTTPFLLLAIFCYSKGSKKHYKWLINNRYLGHYIKNYRAGKGIPLHAKILGLSTLWLSIGFSVIFIIPYWVLKVLLLIMAIAVTVHLSMIKTYKKSTKYV